MTGETVEAESRVSTEGVGFRETLTLVLIQSGLVLAVALTGIVVHFGEIRGPLRFLAVLVGAQLWAEQRRNRAPIPIRLRMKIALVAAVAQVAIGVATIAGAIAFHYASFPHHWARVGAFLVVLMIPLTFALTLLGLKVGFRGQALSSA